MTNDEAFSGTQAALFAGLAALIAHAKADVRFRAELRQALEVNRANLLASSSSDELIRGFDETARQLELAAGIP